MSPRISEYSNYFSDKEKELAIKEFTAHDIPTVDVEQVFKDYTLGLERKD